METRLLTYFLKIAQTGTISQAANDLHVTQPTLSRQLRALEAELATPLFKREQHRMVLTPAGSHYQTAARQILMMVDRAKQDVQQGADQLVGTVAIGCIESNAAQLVAGVISQFHRKFPAVKFELFDLEATDIREKLDQGILDIGIVLQPSETVKYQNYNLVLEDRWGVVVPAESYAQKNNLTFTEFKQLPLILTRNGLVQTELGEMLGMTFQELNVIGTQNLVTNSLYLAQSHVAFPLCAGGAFLQEGLTLKFLPLLGARPIKQQVIWLKQRQLSEATKKFMQLLQDTDRENLNE